MRDQNWNRLFNDTFKKFSNSLETVQYECLMQLLSAGATLDELEWRGPWCLVHVPSKLGYKIETTSGENWVQYTGHPTIINY